MGKEQVTLRELRKDFYKIRKFEIQNLWQRSIFLATFTVILFTGYGFLIEKLISTLCEKSTTCCSTGSPADEELQRLLTHLACSILSFLGVIFSMIWTMMAKGSKAWYEIYERRICKIDAELCIQEVYRMNPGMPWKVNNSLWSREPGAYSVSKINILLGQILRAIWQIALNLHIIFVLYLYSTYDHTTYSYLVTIAISIILIIQIPTPYYLRSFVKSKSIIAPPEEELNYPLDPHMWY